MPEPWKAEFEVTAELAVELIARQFPRLAPVRAAPLGVGWDNVAMLVNDEFVFRFPRRKLGADLIEFEIRAMPTIATLLPAPVPDNQFVGTPSEAFNYSFAGYRLIPGQSVCRRRLSTDRREKLSAQLGAFLRSLHQIPVDVARGAGLRPDPLGRFDFARRIQQSKDKLTYLHRLGVLNDIDLLFQILDQAPMQYAPRADTIIHGDLYSRHVLVDESGNLTGVIDWGDIHLGDPAQDLAAALLLFNRPARERFADHYGPVDDLTWAVARFRALNHTASVLHYACEIRDEDLVREARSAMSNLAGW